jgi:5-methyltetrahydropteroyltriglutamate--homocysteine methyltransferase
VRRSTDRILTTHVGSLARPDDLVAMFREPPRGDGADAALGGRIASAVTDIVAEQLRCGVDLVNDGEMSKVSYATYATDRLTGFDGTGPAPFASDLLEFPEYADRLVGDRAARRMPACTGPIIYRGAEALQRDIANLTSAVGVHGTDSAFMTAASPGVIALFMQNQYYPTPEAYIYALADAMKEEYDAIYRAGLILQVDCPDLAMGRHVECPDATLEEFRARAAARVEVLNHALRDIPCDRMRMHLCWGNYEGPHHHDVALRDVVDIVLQARPAGILFEAANPRHAHEWTVFEDIDLPPDKVLVPGTIDTTTNFVEHPELIAQRLTRFAALVGRERVIAGADCGFSSFAGFNTVDPRIVWAKFQAMAEGARLASSRLW